MIPPFRFGIVEKDVYRGACPTFRNFPFLRTLKLKTMISLLPSKPPLELVSFCQAHGIETLHYEVPKFKGDVTIAPYLIAELLEILIEQAHQPVYVHCLDGGNNTGIVMACLRKLQNWSSVVIGAEFSRFIKATPAYISADEQDFVDAFRAAVRLPPNLPSWLWSGFPVARHPTIPLKAISHDPGVPLTQDTDGALGHRTRVSTGVTSGVEAASHSLQALDMAGFSHRSYEALPDFRLVHPPTSSAPTTPTLARRSALSPVTASKLSTRTPAQAHSHTHPHANASAAASPGASLSLSPSTSASASPSPSPSQSHTSMLPTQISMHAATPSPSPSPSPLPHMPRPRSAAGGTSGT